MEFLLIYALFAITTSLTSIYELVMPVIALRKVEGLPTMPLYLVYPIFIVLNTIIAPMVFFSCVIPSMGERFRIALYNGLYPKA